MKLLRVVVLFVFSGCMSVMMAQSTDAMLRQAGEYVQKKNWTEALDLYTKVLKSDANNPAAYYFRAYVNEKMGRYNFSRYDYEHFLRLAPFNYEGMLGLALLNQEDKHYTEAYDQINNLIEMCPDSVSAYMARAGMEEERQMMEPCLYDWGEVIRLRPDDADNYLTRAELLIKMGRTAEAERDIDKAAELGANAASLKYLYKKIKNKKKSKK